MVTVRSPHSGHFRLEATLPVSRAVPPHGTLDGLGVNAAEPA
jgi:hypothetical protein